MSCTKEEIAEKKRIALERLKSKQTACTASKISNTSLTYPSSIKIDQVNSNLTKNQSFYGETNKQNYASPKNTTYPFSNNQHQQTNKLRASPFKDNRAGLCPYSNNKLNETKNMAAVFRKIISCSVSMITDKRFVITPSGYHAQLIEMFKSISSKAYDTNTRLWSFDIKDYAVVQERIASLQPDVCVGTIPKFVLNICEKDETNTVGISCLTAINPVLVNALMPFQKEGVLFGIQKQGRCLIADEMGLGKTYQALALADFYKHEWPLLICTTAATRDSWAVKVHELLPSVPCHYIVCMASNQDSFEDAKVLIVSYSLMERNCDKLLEKEFGFLILDESHLLKNIKAKSTVAAMTLARKARRVVLLTGTPALSRPVELFSQLQMIDRRYFSYNEYTTRYCAAKQNAFGWDASGQSNLQELNIVLKRKFMIRRIKQQVLSELSEKARETVMLDPDLIWTNNETNENMESYANDVSKFKGRERDELLLKYYNETAHAKSKAVCAYIKGLIKKDDSKFLVFAHHQVMMNAISNLLDQLNVDYVRIDGSTKSDVRTIHVNRFQNNKKCRVAVLSIKACNAGITLTAAQLVLFAELDWNPSILAQAESRAHRIGQDGIVTCRYLLAAGTADDLIWEKLKLKQDVLNKAGLFNEDLSDGAYCAVPCSSGNIIPFLKQIPSKIEDTKKEFAAENLLTKTTTETITRPEDDKFNDDDDDDLAKIIF